MRYHAGTGLREANVNGVRALIVAGALCGLAIAAGAEDSPGVVVERLTPGAAGETAGLRAGDRLTGWKQGDNSGSIVSPFDVVEVELEFAPRGEVHLLGHRGEEPLEVALFPDDWGLELRPQLAPELLSTYHRDRTALAGGGHLTEATARWKTEPAVWLWLLRQSAQIAADEGRTDQAQRLLEEACRRAGEAGDQVAEAHLRSQLGRVLAPGPGLEAAASALETALVLRRSRGREGLALASALLDRARIEMLRRSVFDAQRIREATSLFEHLAPRSLAYSRCLRQSAFGVSPGERHRVLEQAVALSDVLHADGLDAAANLDELAAWTFPSDRAEPLARRALAIRERLAPDGREVAESLLGLGRALGDQGDTRAELHLARRALAILERKAPRGRSLRSAHARLAAALLTLGDLEGAETHFRHALDLAAQTSPRSGTAPHLNNLAIVLQLRGESEAAEGLLERALAQAEADGQGQSDFAARCLLNLCLVARDRGKTDQAASLCRRSAEIVARQVPQYLPAVERHLADVLTAQGQFEEAEKLCRDALARQEKGDARSSTAAALHHLLGERLLARDQLGPAEDHLTQALRIREMRAPESSDTATSAHGLGRVLWRLGRKDEALGRFRQAVTALEVQIQHLGGSAEKRLEFRARYQVIYRDLEELLIELDRHQEAFQTLERSRATGLLALLAGRTMSFAEVPPELESEQQRADRAYDRALTRLLSAPESEQVELRKALDEARLKQQEARARIAAAAPRLAALQSPEPLDLTGVRRSLDPGTLLLAFSVGTERSRLYAVGPGPDEFEVFPLDANEATLREEVARFREQIGLRRGRLLVALRQQSQALGRRLLGPVADRIQRAERLLIVPDGPLHLLPFGALGLASGRYLIEAKPVHAISSVSLFAALRRPAGTASPSAAVAGFGSPLYPPGREGQSPALVSAVRGGLRLDPLPWSGREIAALREVSPTATRLFLGQDASEENAKALDRDTRLVHFACHGFVDERFPLESGLALSIPGQAKEGGDNGLLQAWEVFEGVRLNADLVTLSACKTGLGKELAGEGLLGLTWAFQYAGARSVLASLWEVNDASTAELMKRFYRYLARGTGKAEALRRAQLDLLRRPATSAPFFWAAFQLSGDGS